MRAAIFIHLDGDSSGLLGKALEHAGIACDEFHLHNDVSTPHPDNHDIMIVMGAAQQTWEEEENPWLVHEKDAIRHWVQDLKKPFFGICFGHQLLADSLGGEVGLAETSEIGITRVNRHANAAADPVFSAMVEDGGWMQWHHAEVKRAPEGAEIFASSPDCAIQAMHFGPSIVSIQFHAESSLKTLEKWKDDQVTLDALHKASGEGAYDALIANARERMPATEQNAMRLFNRWIEVNGLGQSRLSA